jgi:hypothetical protein
LNGAEYLCPARNNLHTGACAQKGSSANRTEKEAKVELCNEIRCLAAQYGWIIHACEFDQDRASSQCVVVIHIRGNKGMEQMVKFIAMLKNLSAIVKVQELQVNSTEADKQAINAQITAKVEI